MGVEELLDVESHPDAPMWLAGATACILFDETRWKGNHNPKAKVVARSDTNLSAEAW